MNWQAYKSAWSRCKDEDSQVKIIDASGAEKALGIPQDAFNCMMAIISSMGVDTEIRSEDVMLRKLPSGNVVISSRFSDARFNSLVGL